mgnify:CR=1 FL=1
MKQYFLGFFTAVCLTASLFIFMGSQNKNFGDIIVESITLVNEDGQQFAYIGIDGYNCGSLIAYNSIGEEIISLGYDHNKGGCLKTYNHGKRNVFPN